MVMENVTATAMYMHQSISLTLFKSSSSMYFVTVGLTVFQYLYPVMNSAEQNPYYHYNDTSISILSTFKSTKCNRSNST